MVKYYLILTRFINANSTTEYIFNRTDKYSADLTNIQQTWYVFNIHDTYSTDLIHIQQTWYIFNRPGTYSTDLVHNSSSLNPLYDEQWFAVLDSLVENLLRIQLDEFSLDVRLRLVKLFNLHQLQIFQCLQVKNWRSRNGDFNCQKS